MNNYQNFAITIRLYYWIFHFWQLNLSKKALLHRFWCKILLLLYLMMIAFAVQPKRKVSHNVGKLGLLCWRDVVTPSNSTRHILRNVTFEAKPGEVTAITGTSGAGKTTLLDILAGVSLPGGLSGRILMNDRPMNTANLCNISGYVTQNEALFPLLTVEETLMFSARLRLKLEPEKIKARVQELVRELGLEHVNNKRIGDESHRGVSGGEKRRVSIGVDLVHDPCVLFVDEPTTGLDSASALQVMVLLKSMVREQGKTVIITIHQPGFRILELLDQVVLLSKGAVAHHGPLEILEERLRLANQIVPPHVNVLEFAKLSQEGGSCALPEILQQHLQNK